MCGLASWEGVMALGDGIRRNIASVDPTERALLRDAFVQLNHRFFGGSRTDAIPGGVSWWFKQDEIHQATHVHGGPEFIPWHREIVNRLEDMLRAINPQLSLHYWDWTQNPTNISNANLGGGTTGYLNLFTSSFMGYGGSSPADIGEPWLGAGYYVPGATNYRSTDPFDPVNHNPADPPREVTRYVSGSPEPAQTDIDILAADDFADMRDLMEAAHNRMHGYVNMGSPHISFRDPFVFLLHSNVDRLFARWQTDPAHTPRLSGDTVYGSESGSTGLNGNIEPWAGDIPSVRPWAPPENLGVPKSYKHASVVFPPCYDTNHTSVPIVEVQNAGTPQPVINFNSIPSGETAVRAAVFRIFGCSNVTVRVKAGAGPAAPFSILLPASGAVAAGPGPHLYTDVRIWLAFTAGPAGVAVPDGTATFECPENGHEFTFVLRATVITRPRVAVMMALDQSWSMSWAAGTSGATRVQVLKSAAQKFVELVQQNNGIGLIRFDNNSYPVNDPTFPGLPVTRMLTDDMFDGGRVAGINAVNAHTPNPAGSTSVGDGVDRARQILNALPTADYDQKALIVLTDGLENDPLWISDVLGQIDNRTFAIGLGNEQQVNTTALRSLANGTGGFLYLTGLLSSSIDDYFRLSKFFLQILAGVTNTDIITDPLGYIGPGTKIRIPFNVNEADIECTALVMTDVNVVELTLETPDGTVIDPATAPGLGMTYGVGDQTRHYRYTLPVAMGAGQQAGTWYAVLEVDPAEFKKYLSQMRDRDRAFEQEFATHGTRWSVTVQTYSNLRMQVNVEQTSFQPGASLAFRANLTEYELPVEGRASVRVELTRPGGSVVSLPMIETEAGVFEVTATASWSGIYQARVLAYGATLRGTPFTREHLSTAAVWTGGDQPYQPPREPEGHEWCDLLSCLLDDEKLLRRLEGMGIDPDTVRRCVDRNCGRHHRLRTIQLLPTAIEALLEGPRKSK
jgi:hypothetical protein